MPVSPNRVDQISITEGVDDFANNLTIMYIVLKGVPSEEVTFSFLDYSESINFSFY